MLDLIRRNPVQKLKGPRNLRSPFWVQRIVAGLGAVQFADSTAEQLDLSSILNIDFHQ